MVQNWTLGGASIFFFLKNEQLSMSRVVRLWWGKTQDGAQVQNWAQVVVYGFFVFEK
jgi:hypothetical protein